MSDVAVVTTPVVPTASAATPQSPVVVETATAPTTSAVESTPTQEPGSMQSVIDKITRRQTPDNAFTETATDGTVTDPAAALTDGATIPETPADPSAPPAMVTEITADEPEGEVVLRARDPKTGQFSDMDQTRTYELSIRDKATGETKVYNKTLPDLMRMAKDGIAMQKSRDELTYYREQTPQWQQQHTELQQQVDGLRALALELLTADEGTVIARREAYVAEQSPEKQLQRLKSQLAAQEAEQTRRALAARQEQARMQTTQQVQALASRIGPVVQEVESLVGPEAAAGKLALMTTPLMVNGVIPPERFPEIERYVSGPYRQWAQAEAAKRTTAAQDAQKQLDQQRAEIRQQQARAQQAANNVGTVMRPVGNATAQAPLPKPKNVNETIDRIIRRPLSGAA